MNSTIDADKAALLAEARSLAASLDATLAELRQRTRERDIARSVLDAAEWLLSCFDDIRGVDQDKTRDAIASLRSAIRTATQPAK